MNLRSSVERKNALLKHGAFEQLANTFKRQYRGMAMHAVLVGMMVVAANIRAIEVYRKELEAPRNSRSRFRQRPEEYRGLELALADTSIDRTDAA